MDADGLRASARAVQFQAVDCLTTMPLSALHAASFEGEIELVPAYEPELTSSQSSSSYECDGCAHHASYHSMENKAEDEIRKKWEQEAKEKTEREQEVTERPKKRPRAIGYLNNSEELMNNPGFGALLDGTAGKDRSAAKTKAGGPRTLRAPGGKRTKSRITELTEEEEEVVELD